MFNIGAIFQEGNPLPVLWAIIKLEFTESDIVQFAENKFIQKDAPETPLTNFLAKHGWTFKDRLGSLIIYTRGADELYVKTRSLTSFYNVYELEYPLIEIKANSGWTRYYVLGENRLVLSHLPWQKDKY
jgi:hypothetical protein